MTTLETAKNIVSQLSRAELREFRDWFSEYDWKVWDAEIEEDAAAGKLDAMAKAALAEYGDGKTAEI